MKNKKGKNQIFDRELKLLDTVKEITKNNSISKKELLKEFKHLGKEYQKLLKQAIKITLIGDANQRKLLRLYKLEQEKLQLAQILNDKSEEIQEKNRQLQEQSKKLQELDIAKSRFFTNISHEFRTPLNLIIGPLEQIRENIAEGELKRKVKLMLRNSRRLLNLINQLLELSKLDSGKMKLQVSRQNIVPFLKGILHSFDSYAVENELDLIFLCREEDITLFFDRGKIEEIISNVLVNAVKFTPRGGKITLSLTKSGKKEGNYPSGCIKISVKDTGIGIPGKELSHIFDRFYQAEGLREYNHKGTGIGLALAKELVALHHGDIAVYSSEGEGTEFIVSLPLGDNLYAPEEIVAAPGIKPGSENRCAPQELYTKEKEAGQKDGTPDAPAGDTGSKKQGKNIILVVEDNTEMRYYLRGVLETSFRVVEAKDGKEGIKKAQEIIPDLIISDIIMPGIDGCELCDVLKKDINTSHIPIILLTAKAAEESIVKGLETGADDYIIKPFSTKVLNARVKNLINLRRQLQQKIQQQMPAEPEGLTLSEIDEAFIKELQVVINRNLSDTEFNVEKMSKILYMSRVTLYRKIEALTGESPSGFIRSCRLLRGAELLKNNFGTVIDVASAVGFSSSAYFTKCFKEKFHKLPSSYRESSPDN